MEFKLVVHCQIVLEIFICSSLKPVILNAFLFLSYHNRGSYKHLRLNIDSSLIQSRLWFIHTLISLYHMKQIPTHLLPSTTIKLLHAKEILDGFLATLCCKGCLIIDDLSTLIILTVSFDNFNSKLRIDLFLLGWSQLHHLIEPLLKLLPNLQPLFIN